MKRFGKIAGYIRRSALLKASVLIMIPVFAIITQTGCGDKEFSETGFALNTTCTVTVSGLSGSEADEVLGEAFDAIYGYEELFSRTMEGSDIYRINHGDGSPVEVSDDTIAVLEQALEMGEANACMHRIVAAPTAGACGVLPAVLLPIYKRQMASDTEITEAMYTAAGIGQVIASRAFIAGAAGGCQAEIGSASAMAAGALVCLRGGGPEQITHAAAMALKNLLGLVCDPVAGLVEVPCVKRNVIGAVNAVSSADMALAGITSRIPPDQVIDAMKEVGESMHISLKETGEGGVANTPEARKIKLNMNLQ